MKDIRTMGEFQARYLPADIGKKCSHCGRPLPRARGWRPVPVTGAIGARPSVTDEGEDK